MLFWSRKFPTLTDCGMVCAVTCPAQRSEPRGLPGSVLHCRRISALLKRVYVDRPIQCLMSFGKPNDLVGYD